MVGKVVKNSIYLHNLTNGIYLMRIESKKGFAFKKIIKN